MHGAPPSEVTPPPSEGVPRGGPRAESCDSFLKIIPTRYELLRCSCGQAGQQATEFRKGFLFSAVVLNLFYSSPALISLKLSEEAAGVLP